MTVEGLSGRQLLPQLGGGQAEVVGGGGELAGAEDVKPEAVHVIPEAETGVEAGVEQARAEEAGAKRAALARRDPGLELVGLGPRDPAILERRVHLVDLGRLHRIVQLLGRDAQMLGHRVEEGARRRGCALAGGDRRSAADNDGERGGPERQHSSGGSLHGPYETRRV